MASSDEFILTWKLKKFSRILMTKDSQVYSPASFDINSPVWYLKIENKSNGGESEDFIACYVYAPSYKKENLTNLNLTLQLIGEKRDIICSKRMNCVFKYNETCGWEYFIKEEELRSYFAKCTKDEITLRCCIKGIKKSNVDRLDVVSYTWKMNTKYLYRENFVKELSVDDLFPMKIYLMKIGDQVVVKPEIMCIIAESCSCQVTVRNENFDCINSIINSFERNQDKLIGLKKIALSRSGSKWFFIKCDAMLKNNKLQSAPNIMKFNDVQNLPCVNCDPCLCSDMKKMLIDKIHCDVQIRMAGKLVPAHKNILAARSPVLAAMLAHDMNEATSKTVEFPDCEWKTFYAFLQFLYTEKLKVEDFQTASELLIMANKYKVQNLVSKCSAILRSLLSELNVCKVLLISDLINDVDLKDSAITFIVDNAKKILKSSEWSLWVTLHPGLANQVFIHIAEKFGSG